jgi:hypothetical protein
VPKTFLGMPKKSQSCAAYLEHAQWRAAKPDHARDLQLLVETSARDRRRRHFPQPPPTTQTRRISLSQLTSRSPESPRWIPHSPWLAAVNRDLFTATPQ